MLKCITVVFDCNAPTTSKTKRRSWRVMNAHCAAVIGHSRYVTAWVCVSRLAVIKIRKASVGHAWLFS